MRMVRYYCTSVAASIFALVTCSLLLVSIGCGGGQSKNPAPGVTSAGLAEEQLAKGIGPVEAVEIGPIDEALVARGQQSFEMKCGACHKLDIRYVGPPLGQVLERRTPEFVMNMMLNPDGMTKEHPVAKDLLAQFMTQMPNQNLLVEEARAILEYLRSAQIPSATPDSLSS